MSNEEKWEKKWNKIAKYVKLIYELNEKCYYIHHDEVIPVMIVRELGSSRHLGGPFLYLYEVVGGDARAYRANHLQLRTLDYAEAS